MAKRVGMNHVKFLVRHNALLLREFTTDQLVEATGCNAESVRTEVQRMRQEGMLVSEALPGKRRGRGGRPVLYRLSGNGQARQALRDSVQAFYAPPAPAERPSSRYYLLAQRELDQAQTADEVTRWGMLAEAGRDLDVAEQAEGGSLVPEPVKAHLQFERARLAYLRGEHEQAQSLFDALRGYFLGIQDGAKVRRIDEFLYCMEAERRMIAEGPAQIGAAAWARCLLDTLRAARYQADSPLLARLLELVQVLSQSVGDRVITDMFERVMGAVGDVARAVGQVETGVQTLRSKVRRPTSGPWLVPGREPSEVPRPQLEPQAPGQLWDREEWPADRRSGTRRRALDD